MQQNLNIIDIQCKQHNKPALGICMQQNCDLNRIVCFRCVITDHKHGKDILPIKDIIELQPINNSLWPNDQNAQKRREQIQKLTSLQSSEQVNSQYQDLLNRVKNNILAIQNKVLEAYSTSEEGRTIFIDQLKENFNKAYSLDEVVRLLALYKEKQITHEEFQMNMEHFLQEQSDENQSHIDTLGKLLSQERVKQFLQFERNNFDKTCQNIQQITEKVASAFLTQEFAYAFSFEVVPVKEFQSVKFQDAGITIITQNKSVISSDQILKKHGTYTVSLRLTQYSGGCIVVGIEKEESRLTSSYWQSSPAYCITCNNLDAIKMNNVKGVQLGENVKLFKPIVMKFNQEQELFQLSDQDENNVIQMNNPILQQNDWRFYLFNYSGNLCTFTIDEVSWRS